MWFSLSCLLVKALKTTCVVLGMSSWIEGLVLFCVKFEICVHSLLCFPTFGLPHSTAIDFIHMAFSSKYRKKSDSNVCDSRGTVLLFSFLLVC